MPTTKPWYKSSTFWFNVVTAILGLLTKQGQGIIENNPLEAVGAVLGANQLLRIKTKSGLTLK